MQIRNRRYEAYSNKKNSEKNAVVVKSVLDSDCKRFRDTAMRKNVNLKPETQMEKLIPTTEATILINTRK